MEEKVCHSRNYLLTVKFNKYAKWCIWNVSQTSPLQTRIKTITSKVVNGVFQEKKKQVMQHSSTFRKLCKKGHAMWGKYVLNLQDKLILRDNLAMKYSTPNIRMGKRSMGSIRVSLLELPKTPANDP